MNLWVRIAILSLLLTLGWLSWVGFCCMVPTHLFVCVGWAWSDATSKGVFADRLFTYIVLSYAGAALSTLFLAVL